MEEYLIRFVAGGIAVSAFSALGDMFRPKSFAGLFGAAPSVALATLLIAYYKHGPAYVGLEGRSMMVGAIALAVFSWTTCQLIKRCELSGLTAALLGVFAWFGCALGLCWALFGFT